MVGVVCVFCRLREGRQAQQAQDQPTAYNGMNTHVACEEHNTYGWLRKRLITDWKQQQRQQVVVAAVLTSSSLQAPTSSWPAAVSSAHTPMKGASWPPPSALSTTAVATAAATATTLAGVKLTRLLARPVTSPVLSTMIVLVAVCCVVGQHSRLVAAYTCGLQALCRTPSSENQHTPDSAHPLPPHPHTPPNPLSPKPNQHTATPTPPALATPPHTHPKTHLPARRQRQGVPPPSLGL